MSGESGVTISAALVRRLVASRFPRWSDLPVTPVPVGGWDNRTFRLGGELLVRLPSGAAYAEQVAKEQRWLPVLAPQLPLPIPEPIVVGEPGFGYPWRWSIYRWLPGEVADRADVRDVPLLARDLAAFLNALRRVDPAGGPMPGAHNFFRGGPVATYDDETRRALSVLGSPAGRRAAGAIWGAALAAPWHGPDVWVHGDVASGNLLVGGGTLSAVIDFGCCAVGDPACDLTIAWTFFDGPARAAFRDAVDADAATWARARGWALWKALITTEPDGAPDPGGRRRLTAGARTTLTRVLADPVGAG
jgi:aminoglycoside phosphotransferase (APT) family kinase protein